MSEAKALFRWTYVSRIKNTWCRRAALIAAFPILFLINCLIATLGTMVFAVINCHRSNLNLASSFVDRWKKPFTEESSK